MVIDIPTAKQKTWRSLSINRPDLIEAAKTDPAFQEFLREIVECFGAVTFEEIDHGSVV